MRTNKQVQAFRRNAILFQIAGMITQLTHIRDYWVRAYFLKGMINVCINSLQILQTRVKNVNNPYDIQNQRILEAEKCETWHNLFYESQEDVKYEKRSEIRN